MIQKKLFWRGYIIGIISFFVMAILLYRNFLVQPDISLDKVKVENLNKTPVSMNNFLGKPLVVNYWATWCIPCLEEFPAFDEVNKETGNNVQMVMISDETSDKINKFSRSNPYSFKILRSLHNLSEYGINARPTTYFYNEKGILKHKISGGITKEILLKYIAEIR